MTNVKLTPVQKIALDQLSYSVGRTAYSVGVSVATLRVLERKGLARALPQYGGALGFMRIGKEHSNVLYVKV